MNYLGKFLATFIASSTECKRQQFVSQPLALWECKAESRVLQPQ